MEAIFSILKPILEGFVGNYGWAVQVVMIVGMFRIIFKPLVALVQSVVQVTPTTKDDEFLAKVLANPVYNFFVFLIDWLSSIKLPVAAKKPEVPTV